jgi:single-strand DNA-binding protein
MNHVALIGRLVADPELKYTQSGTAVCHIRLARNERHGEKEKSLFLDVTAWGKLAETLNTHKKQGDQIAITGRLDYQSWTDADGHKRSKVALIADSVEFLARKQTGNGKTESFETHAAAPKSAEVVEEIPF